jgi:hypothetical protein
MEHTQIRLLYNPKKENVNQWQTNTVDLSAYIDFQYTENTEKKEDASQINLINKELYRGKISSYNSGTYTFTVPETYEVNELRWHSFIDYKGNWYVIESNTANTITLSTDYTFPISPTNLPINSQYTIRLPRFKSQDVIQIYVWNVDDGIYSEPSNISDKLAFNGQVKAIKYTEDAKTIILTLGTLSELLMKSSKSWATAVTGAYPKCYQKIQDALNWVNNTNKGAIQIAWAATNPIIKSNGDPFPDKDYYSDYRPAYDIIKEVSRNEYTGDGEYYSFLKPTEDSGVASFDFVWDKKTSTVSNEFVEGEDFKLVSYSWDSGEVLAMLTIRCGLDARGSRISTFVIGDLSNGSRGRPATRNFSGEIITKEITDNLSDFNPEATDGSASFPTSYPYTTSTSVTTEEADQYPDKLSSGTYTATTSAEYNNWIRWLAKARARIWGSNIINSSNRLLRSIKIRYYNEPLSAIPGSLDRFKIPSVGFIGGGLLEKDTRPKLRLISKKVSFDKSGLVIDCDYKEESDLVVE